MIERYPGTDLMELIEGPEASSRPLLIEGVATPALIISGEFDLPSRLNAASRLAARLPCAERAVIPGAGHLPNLDNPDAYNRLVTAFIKRHATMST